MNVNMNKIQITTKTAVPNITVPIGGTRELAPSEILAADSTDYLLGGSLTLRNGRIDKYQFEEGYCQAEKYANNPVQDNFTFFYYDRDHLGSVRQVIIANGTDKGTVAQKMEYYPSGLQLCNNTTDSDVQPNRYNGKELDRMHGLNTYDYGARQYNPVVGRWDRMDPLSEKYYSVSPYAYCAGNPMNYIDPDGRRINYYNSANNTWYTYYNGHFYRYGDIDYNRKTNKVTITGKPVKVSNHPKDYMSKVLNCLNKMASSKDEIIREVFTAAQENAKYDINIRRNLRDEREGSFTRGESGRSIIFLDFEHDLSPGSDMRRNHGTEYDIFGHEFKHAYDKMYHIDSSQQYKESNFTIDEFYTVMFENRLRKDEGNRFMRNNYGRVPIPYQYRKFFMFNRNNRKRYEVK